MSGPLAEIGFGFACSGALITLLLVVGDASGAKLKPRVPGFAFASPGPASEDAAFGAANRAAMVRIMAAMAKAPTEDADGAFLSVMVSHHHGAIDMAWPCCAAAGTGSSSAWRRKLPSPSNTRPRSA